MAKSLRSKWKRKMKAIKRVRYGEKELNKLNKMLEAAKETEKEESIKSQQRQATNDQEMPDVNKIAEKETEPICKGMDVDKPKRKVGKHLRDQFGNYPVWMHQRQIRKRKRLCKHKKQVKTGKKNKK